MQAGFLSRVNDRVGLLHAAEDLEIDAVREIHTTIVLLVSDGFDLRHEIRKVHFGQRLLVKLLLRSLEHICRLVPYGPRCVIGSHIWRVGLLYAANERGGGREKHAVLVGAVFVAQIRLA